MKRMAKIIESLKVEGLDMHLVFVRYNPDAYSVDGRHVRGLAKKARESRLLSVLTDIAKRYDMPPLSIQYMYY